MVQSLTAVVIFAVAESFFHTLKTELIHHEDFQAWEEAHQAIFEYIEVSYNRQRKRSTNGCLAPFVYEHLPRQRKKVSGKVFPYQ